MQVVEMLGEIQIQVLIAISFYSRCKLSVAAVLPRMSRDVTPVTPVIVVPAAETFLFLIALPETLCCFPNPVNLLEVDRCLPCMAAKSYQNYFIFFKFSSTS